MSVHEHGTAEHEAWLIGVQRWVANPDRTSRTPATDAGYIDAEHSAHGWHSARRLLARVDDERAPHRAHPEQSPGRPRPRIGDTRPAPPLTVTQG